MHYETMVQCLADIARKLGVKVRLEEMDTLGGLCVLKGEKILLVNTLLPEESQAEIMAKALADFDLSDVYILPGVREEIERLQAKED